jgi:carbamoyltransferase
MRVLGISGRSRHGAAAIAIDGRLVAAVTEESVARVEDVGYAHTSGLPFGAVRACLVRAGLAPDGIDLVVVEGAVDGDVDGTRARWGTQTSDPVLQTLATRHHLAVDSLTARAAQALPIIGQGHARIAVLDLDGVGHGGIFQADGGQLAPVRAIAGVNSLVSAVAQVTRALGCGDAEPGALYALAENGRPDYLSALRHVIAYREGAIGVSTSDLTATVGQAAAEAPGALSDRSPMHVKVRDVRAGLATSLVMRLAEIAGDVVAEAGNGEGVIASGSLFESAAVVSAVQARVGAFRVAPVPGPFGLALGAALFGSGEVATSLPAGLAIGPSFSEPDVKEVLDGCRLDYVYEPDWPRIEARISRMLSRGKLVAWFQGPMDFGPRSLGGRSILADASNRYARENINRYLRHRPDDQPPPLVMLSSRTGECLVDRVASPLGPARARVKEDWRLRLQAGVDASGTCRVHTVEAGSSRLAALLAVHESLSGIPALLHVDLRGLDEPTACSPRDAIRTTFSSPVDALVIERFLLMKDYWLLRSATE